MNRFLLACAAAIALIAAAYANSLHNSFHFDDSHVIENNLYLRSLANVPRYFTDAHTFSSLPQNATYRPLVTLSLALDYARGALDPRPYHVTQIALFVAVFALLVAFFTPIAGRWPALLAATLFCVHTANTETMNLISARSELLSAIGLLGAFVVYQRWHSPLHLLPLAVGALAKAPVVVFAPLLFVYAMLIEKQPPRRALRIALPSLLLGVALLVFLNWMNAPEWVGGGGSALHYAMTQPFVWLHYARLFVLPAGLTADTDWTPFAQWYDTRAVAGYAFVALLIWAIRRARGPVAFGLAWFAIALLPTSLFPLAEVANEHRVFFAFIGLVLALAAWLPRRALVPVMLALIVANAAGTVARNRVWRSEETLWADVVAKSPGNGRAWMNHGLTRMAKGDFAGARADFERAAALTPNYSLLEINRGVAAGSPVEAEAHFRRALALNPDANAHYFYARWLLAQGRAAEALPHAREAIRQSPAFADAYTLEKRIQSRLALDRGLAALAKRDWTAAIIANREALVFDPKSADAYNNLGWALAQQGRRDEAEQAYRNALALRPGDRRTLNNLRLLPR